MPIWRALSTFEAQIITAKRMIGRPMGATGMQKNSHRSQILTHLFNFRDQQPAIDRVGFSSCHQEEWTMSRLERKTVFLRALATAALMIGTAGIALGDDTPPPANPGPGGRHNNPAWAACKKQADDQKLQPGDARHDFMKNCMKSAKDSGAAPAKT
jgi:hypothetical protein